MYTFQVRATDQAGNTDPTPASFAWTVDTTAPVSSIACNGGGCGKTFTTPVTVTLAATDGGSGVDRILYTLDGSEPSPLNGILYIGGFQVATTTCFCAATRLSTDVDPPEEAWLDASENSCSNGLTSRKYRSDRASWPRDEGAVSLART